MKRIEWAWWLTFSNSEIAKGKKLEAFRIVEELTNAL